MKIFLNGKRKKRSKKTVKKVNCFSFGKQIQSSYLGRVKAKLVSLENDKSFKISKWSPTTKFCPECGCLNKIGLDERIYHCDCGYSYDRDVHAAKNVKLFGSTKRAECLEQASVETLASAALELSDASKLSRRSEKEGSSLKAGISSLYIIHLEMTQKINSIQGKAILLLLTL